MNSSDFQIENSTPMKNIIEKMLRGPGRRLAMSSGHFKRLRSIKLISLLTEKKEYAYLGFF